MAMGLLWATFANEQILAVMAVGYWGYLGAAFANQHFLIYKVLLGAASRVNSILGR